MSIAKNPVLSGFYPDPFVLAMVVKEIIQTHLSVGWGKIIIW